jgi:SOS-response transcriptional repressor LexA
MRPRNSEGYSPSRRQALIALIVRHQREHGRSPSVREIGAALGGLSASGTLFYLEKMVADGLITTEPNRPMKVTDAGYDLAGLGRPVWLSDSERETVDDSRKRGAMLAAVTC